MDIWESNSRSSAVTPHVCSTTGPTKCSGKDCGDDASGERFEGLCDKDGCDFNPYRMGAKNFFGTGGSFDVDTTKPFQVVTQFITSDGTLCSSENTNRITNIKLEHQHRNGLG